MLTIFLLNHSFVSIVLIRKLGPHSAIFYVKLKLLGQLYIDTIVFYYLENAN
jgi:hypothetical protein